MNHSLVGDEENILLLSCSLPPEALKWLEAGYDLLQKNYLKMAASFCPSNPKQQKTPSNTNNPHAPFST